MGARQRSGIQPGACHLLSRQEGLVHSAGRDVGPEQLKSAAVTPLLLGNTSDLFGGWLLFAGRFHLLANVFGFLGAGFRTFFALRVQRLLAAEEFDERLFAAIALAEAGEHDAGISAFAIAEARSNGIKEPGDGSAGHEIGAGLAARGNVATLAQSDHLLHFGTHGFGLGDGGLNALFHDQRSDQIAQKRATRAGIALKLPTCITMTHFFLVSSGVARSGSPHAKRSKLRLYILALGPLVEWRGRD